MKNTIKNLFDFQKFTTNKNLAQLIEKTELKYKRELSDDDLAFVNAAGDANAVMRSSRKTEGINDD